MTRWSRCWRLAAGKCYWRTQLTSASNPQELACCPVCRIDLLQQGCGGSAHSQLCGHPHRNGRRDRRPAYPTHLRVLTPQKVGTFNDQV